MQATSEYEKGISTKDRKVMAHARGQSFATCEKYYVRFNMDRDSQVARDICEQVAPTIISTIVSSTEHDKSQTTMIDGVVNAKDDSTVNDIDNGDTVDIIEGECTTETDSDDNADGCSLSDTFPILPQEDQNSTLTKPNKKRKRVKWTEAERVFVIKQREHHLLDAGSPNWTAILQEGLRDEILNTSRTTNKIKSYFHSLKKKRLHFL